MKGNQNARKEFPMKSRIIFRVDDKTYGWLSESGNPNLKAREIVIAKARKK